MDQNTFDALIDLYYNRDNNKLTQEVVDAMADKNDEEILRLFEDFDSRYAYKYIYVDVESEQERTECAQAYVDRNPGLKTRRQEEFDIYKYGFN